jgi:hypothetical protein
MATPGEIGLYVLDGGRIHVIGSDAAEMADDGAYAGRILEMPVPCFLIRHPDGDLLWDTGMSTTRTDLGDWATPGPNLVDQLRAVGLTPAWSSVRSRVTPPCRGFPQAFDSGRILGMATTW